MRIFLLVLGAAACGDPSHHPATTGGTTGGVTGGTSGGGGDRFSIGSASYQATSGVSTALPALPAIRNLTAQVTGDSVRLSFDPVDGARDYRVYLLPADGDVHAANGALTVHDATYRCAGDRMAPAPGVDTVSQASSWVTTLVDGQDVGGYTRHLAEATLGYVYTTPGSDRVPVYALGDPSPSADNECYFGRWTESRVKKYTSDANERAQLIAARWRDDGIAFYAPATGSAVLTSLDSDTRYYFVDGPEAQMRAGAAPAFNVLAAAADGSEPLMRVFYRNNCGASHDELVAGQARFDRAYRQGDSPTANLHWSGITGKTTLVVEALSDACPWQGMIAPAAAPAFSGQGGDYPAWITIDDARAASPTGEVFINGQGDGTTPQPIARAFIEVSPTQPSNLDFFEGFSQPLAPFADNPDCGEPTNNCWQEFRSTSSDYDQGFIFTETTRHAAAAVMGEFWSALADVGADVGGKFRLTPAKQAQMADDKFLYVTMETDTFSTGRRYPQILITDTAAPVTWTQPSGHALVVQTFPFDTASWPNQLEVEVCNQRAWDVNKQCPAFHDLHENLDAADAKKVTNLAPVGEVGERAGLDRSVVWELYASTKRVYLFLDGQPQGCADLPAGAPPAGAVSVTFGHVLYHSAADSMDGLSDFVNAHGRTESHRHYDNLGWKSGIAAPPWDENLLPCARAAQMDMGE